jgi:putative glutamate/gamma-aminobutyrate antiporter
MNAPKKMLTVWMIGLINVAAICNIKNFPLLAEYGLSVILFLFLSSVFFFIPVALVSAELASSFPDRGVYSWVREGLGPRMGFLAIWLQWIENVIWYPTILSFIAATFSYIFDPSLATNKTYILCTVLVTFWPMTFVNFLGMRISGWISSLSALLGTLVPIALIIVLGLWWILSGHPLQIEFSCKAILPDLTSVNQLVLLSGVLLGLAGIEMSAVHAREVQDPRRNYPRAIFLSAGLILLFSALGALAIATIVPAHQIELASGSMDAFSLLFTTLNMKWAIPLIAAIMTFGALGMMSTWIIGPSRGLLATAEHGDLPPLFQKTNAQGMPVAILITQAVIVTILSTVFLFMPSVTSSYWILVALASVLYMVMYVLMMISAIRLRHKHPHIDRAYQVPGGIKGLWTICLLGMVGSLLGFVLGFLPPSQLDTGNLIRFESFLIGGTVLFCILPLIIYSLRKPHWHHKSHQAASDR